MSQVKIYGLRSQLDSIKPQLSDVIHSCVVDALQYPIDKRFHRFFPLEPDDYDYPAGERTERYTIIELSMFEGRTVEAKKQLIRLLFDRLENQLGISNFDLEITILETPKSNWGIRGLPGDELSLNYNVNV
jgi:phenylpyruvate tautomerase PptA (4-oxalocrotonate tautomerase family)